MVEKGRGFGQENAFGKSRNDQVATDVCFLYVKDKIEEINDLMHGCFKALYNFANDHKETVFPDFTHLQIAQPVVLRAPCIVGVFEKLNWDQNRFVDAYERADFCPLDPQLWQVLIEIDRHAVWHKEAP